MNALEKFSFSDLSSIRKFIKILSSNREEALNFTGKDVNNDYVIKDLKDLDYKIYIEMFYRVEMLKKLD